MLRSYSEMIKLKTFQERFEYLKLNSFVTEETFGWQRYLNQYLYNNDKRWDQLRPEIIIRDNGCDLACPDRPIITYIGKDGKKKNPILIHHINPITIEQLRNHDPAIFDPENLVAVSLSTHNAIHYGSYESLHDTTFVERKPNDTILW